jgi:hypothetical protein
VLDLRDAAKIAAWQAQGTLHAHPWPLPSPPPNTELQQQPAAFVYTMPQHPGLLIVPRAVPPDAQLALAQSCVTQHCEPPARTNHYAEYGPLPGVWAAAQRGLVLLRDKRHKSAGSRSAESLYRSSNSKQAASLQKNTLQPQQQEGEVNGARHDVSEEQVPALEACWGVTHPDPHRTPVTAAAMLRRLRWAVLGPHFDWAARRYLAHETHRWNCSVCQLLQAHSKNPPLFNSLLNYARTCVDAMAKLYMHWHCAPPPPHTHTHTHTHHARDKCMRSAGHYPLTWRT